METFQLFHVTSKFEEDGWKYYTSNDHKTFNFKVNQVSPKQLGNNISSWWCRTFHKPLKFNYFI